ncbi:hypothetical protein AAC387_Pa01g1935 [Persea americana]
MSSIRAISANCNLYMKPHPSATSTKKNLSYSISFKTHLPKTNPDSSSSFNLEKNPRRRRSSVFMVRNSLRGELVSIEEEKSFYELLGIGESGSFEEIKQAYKQMALRYHPDVSPPDRMVENTQRFIRVQEAYETLSDPNTRAMYDRDLARGLHLAFSSRKRFDQGLEERNEWRNRWQSQVSELEQWRMSKTCGENMSWAARMRRQRNAS